MRLLTKRLTAPVLLLILFCTNSLAQNNLNDKLPIDPKVKIGKLSNGLTYYIRQNKKPEQKVELRLVINAGSILEDDDQQGLAHLTEHMAFKGTSHFKKNDIINYLQTIGVGFGNDLNASTNFDETIYILPIPTDKPGNLDKGFMIMQDWAQNVLFNNEDIDSERPVVLEESRLGKGADDRMFRKIYPKLLAGSKYANRLPIGVDSIVKNQKYDVLRRFYKQWYRPDLMAVIIVGDIDPALAETMVKAYFSGLKNPSGERERINFDVPVYTKSEAMIVTDKEATDYSIQINYSAEKVAPPITLADYKADIIKNIFVTLLNQRLREVTQKENPPFVFASAGFGSFARGYEAFSAEIGAGNGDPAKGLEAFVQELERVKKYGFTQAEVDRVKSTMITQMERIFNERDKTLSAVYTDQYIHHFLNNESIAGIENEIEYYKKLLPQITLQQVNAIAEKLKKNANKFIALTGPEAAPGVTLPTADELLAKANAAEKKEVDTYVEDKLAASLFASLPKPGKIISEKKNAYLGTTELVLSNGTSVTLKSTDFKNDQVIMSAIRAGGKNGYSLKDKYNAEYATRVVGAMGIGNFSPVDLRKMLAGKTANTSPVMSSTSDGIIGSSTAKDLETLLQLMHLYFTAPRKDTSLFHSFIQKNKSQIAMLGANPEVAFIDTLFNVAYNNNPMQPIAVPKPEYFDKIDLDRVLQIYKEHFGDATGMHFTIVGSFTKNEILPLIERYIGGLPSTNKKFNYADNEVRSVKGKVALNFNKGKEQKSLIVALYHGELPYSEDLELKARAISEILNIRITEELRQKIQGIYGGQISAEFEKIPYAHYSFFLELPCGPEKVDTLLAAFNKEVENLKKFGPSIQNLNKVKEQWRQQYKEGKKENNTWVNALQDMHFPGADPKRFVEYEKFINALTVKGIQAAAKLLLNGTNVITGILRPEK